MLHVTMNVILFCCDSCDIIPHDMLFFSILGGAVPAGCCYARGGVDGEDRAFVYGLDTH